MMGKFKTILLTLLVALSLVQSYLLAYNKPNPNPLNQPEYVRSDLNGDSLAMTDLIRPKDMVLHFGEDQHTLLYPEEYFFTLIMDDLKDVELSMIHSVERRILNLAKLRREQLGLEVRFHAPVLDNMTRDMFRVQDGAPVDAPPIRFDTLWILQEPDESLRAYLLSDEQVYIADSVDISLSELEKLITFGQYRPLYTIMDGNFYMPQESINVGHQVRLKFTEYTSEQLRNSLFVDPGSSRSIMQRDNNEIIEIIMDGKRGLVIDHTQHWMSYSDPVAPTEVENDVDSNLSSALQFVNQNGGWNGAYMLNRLPVGFEQSYRFMQYFETLPIIPSEGSMLGYIQVTMTDGIATGYERSLINPEWDRVERSIAQLPGGQTLEQMLENYPRRTMVVDLFPAYQPTIDEDTVQLIPRWAVALSNGTYEFLK